VEAVRFPPRGEHRRRFYVVAYSDAGALISTWPYLGRFSERSWRKAGPPDPEDTEMRLDSDGPYRMTAATVTLAVEGPPTTDQAG